MRRLGTEALSEAELVSLLLGGRHEGRTEATAAALVAPGLASLRTLKAGSRRMGARVGPVQLERIHVALELGRRAALLALPERQRLLDPAAVCSHLAPRLAHLEREEFWVILLSARLEELHTIQISRGGITHCSILPREAFAPAVLHSAPSVAFVHNHPSGDPTPSPNDLRLQMMLDEAGRSLGIQVVDHLVITARGHHSHRHGRLSFAGEPIPDPPEEPPLDLLEGEPIAFTEINH